MGGQKSVSGGWWVRVTAAGPLRYLAGQAPLVDACCCALHPLLHCCNQPHLRHTPTPLPRPQELANKLAMQVVGAAPKFLDRSAVPAEALEAESQVLREQALKSGAGAGRASRHRGRCGGAAGWMAWCREAAPPG